MAQWKKVIVSGSAAQLSSLSLDTALTVQNGGTGLTAASASAVPVGTNATTYALVGTNGSGRILRESFANSVIMSGSFSGSFVGNGAGLTGLLADSTFSVYGNDGGTPLSFQTATDVLKFNTASNHGFGFTVSETSNTGSVILQTPQDLRSTANVTFGSVTTTGNVTVNGDLTVLGSVVELQITNLNVEDRFIFLNSGSATGDGGIVVSSGSNGYGAAYGWDESAARWGFQQNALLTLSASALAPEAYVSAVIDIDGGLTDLSVFRRNGNIKIDSGEIYIYA